MDLAESEGLKGRCVLTSDRRERAEMLLFQGIRSCLTSLSEV
jgi:hypothetical protein